MKTKTAGNKATSAMPKHYQGCVSVCAVGLCGHTSTRLSQQTVDHRGAAGEKDRKKESMIQIQTQSGQREKGEKLGHFQELSSITS